MENNATTAAVTLLDGGIGRQLLQMGAPFGQPEWSALALIEAPHFVRQAHEQFALAGSDILTTNSYAVVPYHIGNERFLAEGASLAALSGQLAHDVATRFGCHVAGSLPPLFGSYRPDLFVQEKARALLQVLVDALDPYVDLWLAETLSAIAEAKVVLDTLLNDKRPIWISYTLQDGNASLAGKPHLRSGESVPKAVQFAAEHGAAAILFNCSQPEVMAPAIDAAHKELHHLGINLPIGVYANAFPAQCKDTQANLAIQEVRQDIDPSGYATFAAGWHQQGATIIGGCCGIGPEHIAALHEIFKKNV